MPYRLSRIHRRHLLKHKQIAQILILSSYSKINFDGNLRLEIFQAAYLSIGKALYENKVNIEEMKFLSLFLLNYHFPIHIDIFDKIKKLERLINKLKNNRTTRDDFKQFHILINLVIMKLNHQGIYDDEGKHLEDKKVKLDEELLSRLWESDQIEALIEELCE